MEIFLAHREIPGLPPLETPPLPNSHSLLRELSGWLFAMTSQSYNLLWSLCSAALITCSLHNSQMDSVERGLFPWRGVLLKEQRQVAMCHCSYGLGYRKDSSKWLGKMLRIWERGSGVEHKGFDFYHQHHNNRWANKTQKDFTPRLILTEFFSVSGSPSRALLIDHLWVSLMQERQVNGNQSTCGWRNSIGVCDNLEKYIWFFKFFYDKAFKLPIYV